jgi:carboxylate-amine ligase
MPFSVEPFTIGVEEEYQIINPADRGLRSRARGIIRRAQKELGEEISHELFLSQIECGTPVCRGLREVREALTRLRTTLIRAAEKNGSWIAAAGVHPFSRWREQRVTPKSRYMNLAEELQQVAREIVIFGCHVHVGISDREAAIQVMNRVRPWLSVLLALTTNSPFWMGENTGYASYRTIVFGQMPMVDTPRAFASRAEFDALVEALVASDSISDGSKLYWDIRPSAFFETIEFRVCDVCTTIDEAVIVAALCRSLARTAHGEFQRDEPCEDIPTELLRAAKWRAARFGLDMDLIDVQARHSVPAIEMVRKLLTYLRPDLERHGEWDEVAPLVHELLERGNGAQRQRSTFERTGKLEDVVDQIVEETARGTLAPVAV